MNELVVLATAIGIALVLSTVTVITIHAPLQRLLEVVCPVGFTAVFWMRAAVLVIYLLPLWVVLVFGLPNMQRLELLSVGEVMRRAFGTTAFALVAIVIGIGLSILRRSRATSENGAYAAPSELHERFTRGRS